MTVKRYALGMLLAAMSLPSHAQPLSAHSSDKLAPLEARLAVLESRLQHDNLGWLDRVSINGFMTFGVARHNVYGKNTAVDEVRYGSASLTDEISYQALSLVGLQLNAELNARTQMVVQLLARGEDDYNLNAQWAYLDYALTPSMRVRGGRLLLPFFMHSQYSNVGYGYHWVSLPEEVYGLIPFDSMDGVDVSWSFNNGPVSHRLNLFAASMDVPENSLAVPVTYEVRDMVGANLHSHWRDWSSWLSYNHGRVSLVLPGMLAAESLDQANTYVSSVGAQYDNGRWVLMAERAELGIEGWFPKKWAGYLSAGYRWGSWMPSLTWAATNSQGLHLARQGGAASSALFESYADRQKSWTLGTRYELAPRIAVKGEVKYQYDFSRGELHTNGLFRPQGEADLVGRSDPLVYRVSIDAAF